MANTLSFDASMKVTRSNYRGLGNHMFRDVLSEELEHSNEMINSELTENNQTLYYNQTTGKFEVCTDIEQIYNSLETRLATVTKPLRKDAVVVRSMILQLDSDFYEDATEDEKNKSYDDMLEWACKRFREKNLIGISVHEDESNPHIHLWFTPVTEDGRLSQKDWFKNPKEMRSMHEEFRQHMTDRGYDISMERQPKRKHMTETEYKTFMEAKEKVEELQSWEKELKQRSNDVKKRENAVATQQQQLTERLSAPANQIYIDYLAERGLKDDFKNFYMSYGEPSSASRQPAYGLV